jgi:hypothetical protein
MLEEGSLLCQGCKSVGIFFDISKQSPKQILVDMFGFFEEVPHLGFDF